MKNLGVKTRSPLDLARCLRNLGKNIPNNVNFNVMQGDISNSDNAVLKSLRIQNLRIRVEKPEGWHAQEKNEIFFVESVK